jgi:hypothetical protein
LIALGTLAAVLLAGAPLPPHGAAGTVAVRGRAQAVRVYGPSDGIPAVVASGDGGWVHLGPQVAEFLAARGYHVVGVDSKAYLASFTAGATGLDPAEVPGDFRVFMDAARGDADRPVLLAGVSEGAGLALLAAAEAGLQPRVAGIVALGLCDHNELAWRLRDSVIYVTHGKPREPFFRAADYIPRLGSTPLAAVHSTHDEFAPLGEIQGLMALPGGPKRLWVVDSADHAFSDSQPELQRRMLEAIEWIRAGAR